MPLRPRGTRQPDGLIENFCSVLEPNRDGGFGQGTGRAFVRDNLVDFTRRQLLSCITEHGWHRLS